MSLLSIARSSSLGNSFRISLTVFGLFCYCHLARPWFRFSTRTSSVGLALCLFAFTRATSVVLFSWRELTTERNEIRSVNFDPLLLETRGVFFWKALRENFSTFFSGRVRRLFSARTEFPYTPSKNLSGYMRSFLGEQC